MQAALHRYLVEKKYPGSILQDLEFKESRDELEGKAWELRAKGMGKQPHAADSISNDEEEILWENRRLGADNPQSLLNTVVSYYPALGVERLPGAHNHDARRFCYQNLSPWRTIHRI